MEINAKLYTRKNGSGTHYARLVAPKELRCFLSKPALWRSLGTKETDVAHDKGAVVAAAAALVFQEVADARLDESSEVKIAVELEGSAVDLSALHEKIDQDDLLSTTKSLKKSLGVKETKNEKKPAKTKKKTARKKKDDTETDATKDGYSCKQ